jgi:cytochrome P450
VILLMFFMPSKEISTTECMISTANMVLLFNLLYLFNAGDVVRIQPNHLSFTNIEALRDIYGFQAKAVKGDMYVNIFQLTGASVGQNLFSSTFSTFPDRNLTCRDRQYHDKFRRIFGPAFTNTALTKFEPNIHRHFNKVVRAVRALSSQGPVDMTLYCKYFVMDVD